MNDDLLADLLSAVEQQLVSPQTPYVAKTFARLVKLGMEESEAKSEIALCLGEEMDQVLRKHRGFDEKSYRASLEALLRTARAGQAVRPDYVVKVVDAMLCHLAQWRQTSEDAGPLPGAAADQLIGRISLRELFALIDAQLGRNLCLDELARCTGLSRAAFTRGFRQATGLSAHQALNLRRIEVAKKLLADTDLDLAFIAQETGWSSQSHFTASFRNAVGCTPARFRALH